MKPSNGEEGVVPRSLERGIPQSRRWLRVGTPVLVVVALAVVIRTAVAGFTTDVTDVWGAFFDFRNGSYFPVTAALDGRVPWHVSDYLASYPVASEFGLNPPTYLVLHAPLQLFDYTTASIIMLILNLIGMVAFARWSLTLARFDPTRTVTIALAALVISSTPGRAVLIGGQSALLFSAAVYFAFTTPSERVGASAVFVSLAKPTFGLPATVLAAAAGRTRRAIAGVTSAIALSAILMVPFIVRAGGIGNLINILIDNVSYSGGSAGISLETSHGRIDVAIVLARVFNVIPSPAAELAITLLLVGGAAALLFRRRALLQTGTYGDAAVVLACLATVCGIYHSFYDMVLLVLPGLLLSRADFAGGSVSRGLRWGALAGILVAVFNPFIIDRVLDMRTEYPRFFEVAGPGLTGAALLVAFACSALVVWRLPPHGADAEPSRRSASSS